MQSWTFYECIVEAGGRMNNEAECENVNRHVRQKLNLHFKFKDETCKFQLKYFSELCVTNLSKTLYNTWKLFAVSFFQQFFFFSSTFALSLRKNNLQLEFFLCSTFAFQNAKNLISFFTVFVRSNQPREHNKSGELLSALELFIIQ